ncbi:MAG: FkbM family methyltransferase [Patescibacteria group bacterium]|nr:FkbM family methyltransferase [Patescibacteria group bacterium]
MEKFDNSIEAYKHGAWEFSIRERNFKVGVTGSRQPTHLLRSFFLEEEMRNEWWQIQPGDIVIDVGAAYGSYTLSAIALGAKLVIAYEPSRNEFFDLHSNLLLNSFLNRCVVINTMAGNESWGVAEHWHNEFDCPGESWEYRRVFSIDALIKWLASIDQLNWIKIDTEGAEFAVLEGAKETIQRFHPKIITENHLEIDPMARNNVCEFLKPLGYMESHRSIPGGANEDWSLFQHQDDPKKIETDIEKEYEPPKGGYQFGPNKELEIVT